MAEVLANPENAQKRKMHITTDVRYNYSPVEQKRHLIVNLTRIDEVYVALKSNPNVVLQSHCRTKRRRMKCQDFKFKKLKDCPPKKRKNGIIQIGKVRRNKVNLFAPIINVISSKDVQATVQGQVKQRFIFPRRGRKSLVLEKEGSKQAEDKGPHRRRKRPADLQATVQGQVKQHSLLTLGRKIPALKKRSSKRAEDKGPHRRQKQPADLGKEFQEPHWSNSRSRSYPACRLEETPTLEYLSETPLKDLVASVLGCRMCHRAFHTTEEFFRHVPAGRVTCPWAIAANVEDWVRDMVNKMKVRKPKPPDNLDFARKGVLIAGQTQRFMHTTPSPVAFLCQECRVTFLSWSDFMKHMDYNPVGIRQAAASAEQRPVADPDINDQRPPGGQDSACPDRERNMSSIKSEPESDDELDQHGCLYDCTDSSHSAPEGNGLVYIDRDCSAPKHSLLTNTSLREQKSWLDCKSEMEDENVLDGMVPCDEMGLAQNHSASYGEKVGTVIASEDQVQDQNESWDVFLNEDSEADSDLEHNNEDM